MHIVDEFFRESYYNSIRILLTVCGLWPFQSLNKRYAMYVGFMVIFGSGITFQLLCMIEVWPDFFEVFDCLSMLFYALTSTFKLIYTVFELPKIEMLLMKIYEHWCSPKSDKEIKILRSYIRNGRKLGYAYAGIIVSHAVVFALTPFVTKYLGEKSDQNNASIGTQNAETESSHRISYMLDLQMHSLPIFIQSAICEVYYTVLVTSFNVLYVVCVQHCCGLFAALRYRLETALEFENDGDDSMTMNVRDKSYLNIVYSIRRHAEVMQFATVIESLYRLPFFLHMTVNASLLSIVGFQVISNTKNINRILPYASYLNALMLNTFFENWQGQKIMDCNEKVHESAYQLEWYKMPIVTQKLLIIIMLRSTKPLTITAGNILVLSYVTFNAVMRAAFSYFTLLRSAQ